MAHVPPASIGGIESVHLHASVSLQGLDYERALGYLPFSKSTYRNVRELRPAPRFGSERHKAAELGPSYVVAAPDFSQPHYS